MTQGQILNMVFIILGLTGAIYGLYSILIRTIKKNMRDEMNRMENDIIEKMKGVISHAGNR